jgi:hypothetical protein
MFKQRKRGDDNDDDAHRILADGERMRVPMHMMDSVQRSVAQHLHDGHGNRPGHRPGFAMSDANDDARQAAYDEYRRDVENAWRGAGREGAENSICTVRNAQYPRAQGAPGHVRNGICVPDDEELRDALPTRDSNMADVYAAYDARIREMWRNP